MKLKQSTKAIQVTQQSFSLIVDFEATGVKPEEARPLEIAVMAVDSVTLEPEMGYSQVIYDADYPEIDQKIHDLTGISLPELHVNGKTLETVLHDIADIFSQLKGPIDYIIAYNKEYDEVLYKAEAARKGISIEIFNGKQWLCAMKDVEPNYKHKCWKLSHLALDHGVAVDPVGLHRAMADVSLVQKFLEKIEYSAHDMFHFNQVPWVTMQALVPSPWTDGGKGVELAKARGYSWEKLKGTEQVIAKSWVKRVKATQVDSEVDNAPFKVRTIE